MSQEKKWVFFPYTAPDYKVAEDWLNERCQEGWRPEKFGTFFHRIKLLRQDGLPVCCCTDLYDTSSSPDWDYLALCQQAGWTRVGDINGIRLFVSQPGEKPAPIQTDQDMELERFKRFYLKRSLWDSLLSFALVAIFLGFFLWAGFSNTYKSADWNLGILQTWQGTLCFPALLFSLFMLFGQTARDLRFWRRACRAVEAGAPLPRSSRRQIHLIGYTMLLFRFFIPLFFVLTQGFHISALFAEPITPEQARTFPVVMAQDVGLPTPDFIDAEQSASPLARYSYSWESVNFENPRGAGASYWLKSSHYDCATEGLARWVALQLQISTQAENFLPDFQPVALGFDESWLFVDEPNEYSPHPSSALVLRQGKTAVLLQGPVDWTNPDILPILWERLALSPP